MKKDDININEAYSQVIKQQLEEGILDVAKSRGAQAIGAVKGFGQKVGGMYKQAKGGLVQKAVDVGAKAVGLDPKKSEVYQKAKEQQRMGKAQVKSAGEISQGAKYNTYINSALDGLVKDLKRLNIPVRDENVMNTEFYQDINLVRSHYEALGGDVEIVPFESREWKSTYLDMGNEEIEAYIRMHDCLNNLKKVRKDNYFSTQQVQLSTKRLPFMASVHNQQPCLS